MRHTIQFLIAVLLVSVAAADAEPASRPAATEVALYLPADPPGLDSDYTVGVQITNGESETINSASAFWRYVDPALDDVRERYPGEWRVLIAFHAPSGPVVGGGSWHSPHHVDPVSAEPGKTVMLSATVYRKMLPAGPIRIRALLQHNGQTIASSPEATIERR